MARVHAPIQPSLVMGTSPERTSHFFLVHLAPPPPQPDPSYGPETPLASALSLVTKGHQGWGSHSPFSSRSLRPTAGWKKNSSNPPLLLCFNKVWISTRRRDENMSWHQGFQVHHQGFQVTQDSFWIVSDGLIGPPIWLGRTGEWPRGILAGSLQT